MSIWNADAFSLYQRPYGIIWVVLKRQFRNAVSYIIIVSVGIQIHLEINQYQIQNVKNIYRLKIFVAIKIFSGQIGNIISKYLYLKMENVSNNSNKENELSRHQPKVSIQQAFKKFQKQKFYQLKLNKYLKNVEKDRTSPEFKQELRQKFIQTSKKYIGVPYAQKYHQPGDQLYNAPLFIDCCALVKQCVFDLRQQFGFTLGKWNQAYQFDMLPDENLKEEDLKPGDLIFYSATYYNPKLKPFPHKMVHVQIYLGEGKSIGARWQKGTIKIFDSYKFQSTLYYDIQYHYRSIDSWLEGRCQNHCKQHKWLDDRANDWLSDKFSVFADPSLDDMNITTNQTTAAKNIMIGKGNNSKLIRQYFSDGGKFNILPEKDQFSPHFYYKWVQSSGQVDFYSFKQGQQVVNHIPNICVIASKLELLKTFGQWETQSITKGKAMTFKMDDFIPKTYRLNIMSDQIEFLNDKSSGIWIYKPRNLNQGRGIRIVADIEQFKKEFINSKKFYLGQFSLNNMLYYKPQLLNKKEQTSQQQSNEKIGTQRTQIRQNQKLQSKRDDQAQNSLDKPSDTIKTKYSDLNHDGLIQHYIQPLLLNGKKFDIRCYMLLNSQPGLVLFQQGYLRLTIEQYSEEDMENEQKLMVHLTNNCFQHKHKDYKTKKEQTIGKWTLLESQIGKQKTEQLRKDVKRIMLVTYAAAKRKLISKRGTYELLGFDILVDKNCKAYLLEVNTNPALFTDTSTQKEVIPPVVKNSINIALGMFESPERQQQYCELAKQAGFEVLYSEQRKFMFQADKQQVDVIKTDYQQKQADVQINGIPVRIKMQQKWQLKSGMQVNLGAFDD